MNPQNASRTAVVASLSRAVHTRTDPQVIHADPWGDRLFSAATWHQLYQVARLKNPQLPEAADDAAVRTLVGIGLRRGPAYPNIIVRSRFAEDALQAAAARGVRQYVLLGAGFDSYALRMPSPEVRSVIEIDHPATQAVKRQCIAQAGVGLPEAVHFVAADLSTEDLSAVLIRSLPQPHEPAFFSWLGVTMYLTEEANLQTLRAIASTAAAGSELVFEYVDQRFFDTSRLWTEAEIALRQTLQTLGEPWLCGFDPAQLPKLLASAGFDLIEDVPDTALVERYDPQKLNGLQPRGLGRLAHVRVGQGTASCVTLPP